MIVFTLPSYDVVFKLIRDHFDAPKESHRSDVMRRYKLVFEHDRAGRLIEAHEFEHLRIPRLLEVLERLTAHRGVDVQVADADDGAELFEHEEDDAVVDHGAPVAAADEILFFFGQSGFLEGRFRIRLELVAMIRIHHVVQEFIQAVRFHAPLECEGIRARNLLGALELAAHVMPVLLRVGADLDRRLVLVDRRGDGRHRREVVALMHLPDVRRQGAAHHEPHDDLGSLEAAQRSIFSVRQLAQPLGILLDQLQELHVPGSVVEACPLAGHLMRQAAGGDDGDFEIFGVALDGAAQRLAELVAAAGRRNRKLQDAHDQRNDRRRPAAVRLPAREHRQRREQAVVERLVLEERHVELVGHQRLADVARERGMTDGRREVARAAAFVGDGELFADPERERGVVIEEERGDVIVEDEDHHVGLLVLDPLLQRLVVLENRRPRGVVAFVAVEGEADGRGM